MLDDLDGPPPALVASFLDAASGGAADEDAVEAAVAFAGGGLGLPDDALERLRQSALDVLDEIGGTVRAAAKSALLGCYGYVCERARAHFLAGLDPPRVANQSDAADHARRLLAPVMAIRMRSLIAKVDRMLGLGIPDD